MPKQKHLTRDDVRDLAIRVTDQLVSAGLITDCLDTDDDTEFSAQDLVQESLEEVLHERHKLLSYDPEDDDDEDDTA